jgi:hypothetical protein
MSPVAFPDIGSAGISFDLDWRADVQETEGGKEYVALRGVPRWVMAMRTQRLGRVDAQKFSAFWNALKGGLNTFTMHHPERAYPLAYPTGFDGMVKATSGAFDGTAEVNALTTTSLTLTGLPADFEVTQGDPVGLVESGKYGLYEAAADATGDADGVLTVTVQPFIATTVFTTAATANFAKALGEFRGRANSLSNLRERARMPASFSARQVSY